MIDYDDLRRKAEAARLRQKQYERRYELYHPESAEFLYSGPRMEHALAEHREAATPDVALRLLRIIAVATEQLEKFSEFDLHSEARRSMAALAMKRRAQQTLDEIAEIENED